MSADIPIPVRFGRRKQDVFIDDPDTWPRPDFVESLPGQLVGEMPLFKVEHEGDVVVLTFLGGETRRLPRAVAEELAGLLCRRP